MPFWSKRASPSQATGSEAKQNNNILVISDIHLGEDILAEDPSSFGHAIRLINREVANFLEFHAKQAQENRSWSLIINGDFFDFAKLPPPPPAEGDPKKQQHRMQESHSTPEITLWKLNRIIEIHKPVFKGMAQFLAAGHRIVFLGGNHDAEFYFPEIKQAISDEIIKNAKKLHEGQKTKFALEELQQAISFPSWFEADLGQYHIEHGHQYDAFCSFEYPLAPLENQNSQHLATPFSHRALPHLSSILKDFSSHGIENNGFWSWVRVCLFTTPKSIWALLKLYFNISMSLITESGAKRKQQLEKLQQKHRKQLKDLVKHTPYGEQTLQQLDQLKATPVELSRLQTIHTFFFDRVVLLSLTIILICITLLLPGHQKFWLSGLVLLSSSLGHWWLARLRNVSAINVLRHSAAQIAYVTGARYVIFGHSHHPEMTNITKAFNIEKYGQKSFYINSGSWVTREILLGEKGKAMTYVEITSSGACVKRWHGLNKEPSIIIQETS